MVFVARLICSDPACAEDAAVEAATLRELEILACECGCALEVIGWPDTVGGPGATLRLVEETESPAEIVMRAAAAA